MRNIENTETKHLSTETKHGKYRNKTPKKKTSKHRITEKENETIKQRNIETKHLSTEPKHGKYRNTQTKHPNTIFFQPVFFLSSRNTETGSFKLNRDITGDCEADWSHVVRSLESSLECCVSWMFDVLFKYFSV